MSNWLRLAAVFSLILVNCKLLGCRSTPPGAGGAQAGQEAETREVSLPGVDTSALTGRERRQWSEHVLALSAPCPEAKVTLHECARESTSSCSACIPAAKYLMAQVRAGLSASQVENAYRLRFSPDGVRPIDTSESPSKGAQNARVTVVEFADFECPACRAVAPVLDEVVTAKSSEVKLVFKNFPLPAHPNSELAARSSVAAGEQGKFWEMHRALFQQGPPLDRITIEKLANGIGLDMKQFTRDLESEKAADQVQRDRKQGEEASVKGTPTLFINGRRFESSSGFKEDLEAWLDLEIQLTKQRPGAAGAQSQASQENPAP